MDIWNTLGIEPTTDKKAIKKAYAAKARIIHPEEKPDEFRLLYEAYQLALGYIGETREAGSEERKTGVSKALKENRENPDSPKGKPAINGPGLLTYFQKNQELQNQRIAAFYQWWQGPFQTGLDGPPLARWKSYLASVEFQGIRSHPEILDFLARELQAGACGQQMKMLFWDAYGFQEEGGDICQEKVKALWQILLPAYGQQRYQKKQKLYRRLILGAVLALAALVPLDIHYKRENGRRCLVAYMEEKYPEISFSQPGKGVKGTGGNITYTLHPSSHPDFSVTAQVKYLENSKTYEIAEDYPLLLLEHYASQYGLSCGRTTYGLKENDWRGMLCYPNHTKLNWFCETVSQMFREQKELQNLPPVAIFPESARYPQVLREGGVNGFPFPEEQFYEPWAMEPSQLENQLRQAYLSYMFLYEPWNLKPLHWEKWGQEYESLCRQWENYSGAWYEFVQNGTGKVICRFYVPVYASANSSFQIGGRSFPDYRQKLTAGNAFLLLMANRQALSPLPDGSGFTVTYNGTANVFGDSPEVDFSSLSQWLDDRESPQQALQILK